MNRMFNKILNIASLLAGIGAIIWMYLNLSKFSAISIWIIITLVSIYFNGLGVRMVHMSKVKMEHISYGDDYEAREWYSRDIGSANMVPLIMEIQYQRNLRPLIQGVIEEYREDEVHPPISFRVANILLSMRIFPITALLLIISTLVLPKVLNDYTLYWGMEYEQFLTTVLGFAVFFELTLITLYNYVTFNIINYSMDSWAGRGVTKAKKGVLLASLVFATYTFLMVLFILIMGITGIEIPIFKTLVNPKLLNLFVVIAPMLSILQALVVKRQLSGYQYLLNDELA